mgnify:CR=1 FL=1
MRVKFVIFSLLLRLWLKTIAWASAEMSHRGTEWTKNFLNKAIEVTEAPSVHGAAEEVYQFY